MIGVAGVQRTLWCQFLDKTGRIMCPCNIGQDWPNFSKFIKFGAGNRVQFWHDLWCEGCTLREAFLELYSISCNNESAIFPKQRLDWDLQFSRAIQNWELEPLTAFLEIIYSIPLNGDDKLCQKPAKNKGFKVCEYYFSLPSTPSTLFLLKLVWCSKIPPRVAFFSWTTALEKILNPDNLWNQGVTVVDWCYMCKWSGESINHLLLHCPIAFELWTMVWALFGLLWVMPQSVNRLIFSLAMSFQ